MSVTARNLGDFIGKPIGLVDGFDIIAGEVMGVTDMGDYIKVVLFEDDGIDMRAYILSMDHDREVDVMVEVN